MFRSWLLQQSARSIGQGPVTWSRLFHIRKSLCLAFKPGTSQSARGSDEIDEPRDSTFKQSKYRHADRQSRTFGRERTRFPHEREEQNIDRQEMRYNRQFPASRRGDGSDFGGKTKSFAQPKFKRRETTQELKEEQQYKEFRSESDFVDKYGDVRSARGSDETDEQRDSTFKQGKYRHADRQSRTFDRERTKFPYEREEQNFDRQEMRYNREFPAGRRGGRPEFGGKTNSFAQSKFKRRVFTEQELKEEQEFEEFRPESDSSDTFGAEASYFQDKTLDDTGAKKRLSESRIKPRAWPSKKSNMPRDWSESFGTLDTNGTDPSLQDVLFGEDQASRPEGSETDLAEEIVEEEEDDEDDFVYKPHIPLSRTNRRHIPAWYARKIQQFGKKGMVKEAIEVFDKWMIEQDRVKPTHYEYGLLITLLGKAGYHQKAFKLFNEMQKMDLVPEGKVFTSLFNACAKTPFTDKEYGLKRANRLRSTMIEQGIEPPLITYQAMISAFGMCGDTEMAFNLVDEVLQRYRPNTNLLCSALIACISDKEAGFRHAIQVWRKFLQKGVKPDIKSHNLLLRAVNECGVGPLTTDNNLILIETGNQDQDVRHGDRRNQKKIVSSLQLTVDPHNLSSGSVVEVIEGIGPEDNMKSISRRPHTVNIEVKREIDGNTGGLDITERELIDKTSADATAKSWWEYDLEKYDLETQTDTKSEALVKKEFNKQSLDGPSHSPVMMPDVLNPFDKSLQVVSLGWIKTCESRLALIGGLKGFLSNLEKYGEKPDIVTFTQLMSVVPASEENEVLDMMELYDVEPDIDFFNHLINKRANRWEKTAALEVQKLIEKRNLIPNIRTYGCLAKACSDYMDGKKLLEDMEKANMSPNTMIMQSLVSASRMNFGYKTALLKRMKKLDIKARSSLINRIEIDISRAKDIIVQKEQGKEFKNYYRHKAFDSDFKKFMEFYNDWVKGIPLEQVEHPWSEYRDSIDEVVKDEAEEPKIRNRNTPVQDSFSKRGEYQHKSSSEKDDFTRRGQYQRKSSSVQDDFTRRGENQRKSSVQDDFTRRGEYQRKSSVQDDFTRRNANQCRFKLT